MRGLVVSAVAPLVCGLVALGLGPPAEAEPDSPSTCELGTDEANWLQGALDAWVLLTGEVLDIPSEPLPWIVTFDEACVWHLGSPGDLPEGSSPVADTLNLGGRPVRVRSLSHEGAVTLPNGSRVPARAMAFASLWDEGRATFFVLAMRSLWHRDQPESRKYDLGGFFLGVASHEMVHTRQLVAMNRRFEAMEEGCALPEDVDDTTIEEQFADDPAFARALAAERELLVEAALGEPNLRAALAVAALEHLRERRERYFTGDAACFSEVEDLFLALEGIAVWAHYRLARLEPEIVFLPERPELRDRRGVLERLRAKQGEWVQDAGFALSLLLDDFVPGWRDRMLGAELASPVELLEEALAARDGSPPGKY